MEKTSDLVIMGRLLHETSYTRKRREVQIGRVKIDYVASGPEIHEIKRSRKGEEAHVYQLLYYLYLLKRLADITSHGVLHYPLLRKTVKLDLTEDRIRKLEYMLEDLEKVSSSSKPPEPVKVPYCRRCSYSELCWGAA